MQVQKHRFIGAADGSGLLICAHCKIRWLKHPDLDYHHYPSKTSHLSDVPCEADRWIDSYRGQVELPRLAKGGLFQVTAETGNRCSVNLVPLNRPIPFGCYVDFLTDLPDRMFRLVDIKSAYTRKGVWKLVEDSGRILTVKPKNCEVESLLSKFSIETKSKQR